MANLEVTDRNSYERADLHAGGAIRSGSLVRSLSPTGTRVLAMLTLIFLGVLGVLTYAAVQRFDGWPHAIVLGDMVLVLFCVAAWINPRRKRIY